MAKSKCCPVCGQRPCVKNDDCESYRKNGTINGQKVTIYTYPPKRKKGRSK